MRPVRSQLARLYGGIIDGVWAEETMWMSLVTVPGGIQPYWKFGGKVCQHVDVHKDMAGPLQLAWANLLERGCQKSIISFDGCLNVRQSRTDQRQSVHSWGLALDLNAAQNLLGSTGNQNPVLVGCFTDAGFVWGGTWKNPDPMHLQYVTED